jgi:hypothetical protein
LQNSAVTCKTDVLQVAQLNPDAALAATSACQTGLCPKTGAGGMAENIFSHFSLQLAKMFLAPRLKALLCSLAPDVLQ